MGRRVNGQPPNRPLWRRIRARIYMWPILHLPLGTLDRPIESFVALLCCIAGATQLLGLGEQQSVSALLPTAVVRLWSFELVIGGATVLVSVWTANRRSERSGLVLLGVGALVYAICALVFLGTSSVYTAAVTLAFSAAVWIRAIVISLLIQLERALRDEDRRG